MGGRRRRTLRTRTEHLVALLRLQIALALRQQLLHHALVLARQRLGLAHLERRERCIVLHIAGGSSVERGVRHVVVRHC